MYYIIKLQKERGEVFIIHTSILCSILSSIHIYLCHRVYTIISIKYLGARLKLLHLNVEKEALGMVQLGCFHLLWWLLCLGNLSIHNSILLVYLIYSRCRVVAICRRVFRFQISWLLVTMTISDIYIYQYM